MGRKNLKNKIITLYDDGHNKIEFNPRFKKAIITYKANRVFRTKINIKAENIEEAKNEGVLYLNKHSKVKPTLVVIEHAMIYLEKKGL